jgi:WD40 repeat protein
MTVSTSTLFCIVCGREFRPRDADTVICPDCGGPPEAPAPSQPQGTVLADQPRGTVLMSQPAYQRMCILCGQDFTTPDPQADRCPQCRGEAPQSQPEIRSRPESRQSTPAMPAAAQGTVAMPESGTGPTPWSSPADVPLTWNAGDVILDLYEVKGELGKGGMGVVYRVHHRQWNIDLAVKTPLPEALQKAGSLENFLREAQAWVDLGLHPHIVTCYYVRRLGEMPRVFAECMEGGSLKNWMEDGRLYAGGEQDALKRILDCAIQFAWGLGYAHEKGLVHQDVKPANALMTPDGMLKVTDFGLVGAKGYTEAYAAPEQELGQAVSPRTDLWGWGVSVLEMFTGGVHWQFGSVAASVLENYLQEAPPEGIPPMPAALAELLRQCFQNDPDQRPASMDEVAERLIRLYKQETGAPYPRQKPKALELRADSLNNKAVSLLDLGQEEEAVRCWQEALQADPAHLEANFNYGYYRWQKAELLSSEFLKQLQQLESTHASDPQYWRLLGWVYLEQGYVEEVDEILTKRGVEDEALHRAHSMPKRSVGRNISKFTMSSPKAAGMGLSLISSVAFSPDGHWALLGGLVTTPEGLKTLWLYDLGNAQELQSFVGHSAIVNSVAFSPDGCYALSGSNDGTMRLWDIASGREIYCFRGHTGGVNSVAFSPDGRCALSAEKTIRLWDVVTRQEILRFEGHDGNVLSIAISTDGRWVLSGSTDKTVRLWDIEHGREVHRLTGHTGWIFSVDISPNGLFALSGSADKTVRLWNISAGDEMYCFTGHRAVVRSVVFHPTGEFILSGDDEGVICLWRTLSGQEIRRFTHHGKLLCIDISQDGQHVLSTGYTADLSLWKMFYTKPEHSTGLPFPILSRVYGSMELVLQQVEASDLLLNAGRLIGERSFRDAFIVLRKAQKVLGYERDSKLLEFLNLCGRNGQRRGLKNSWCVGVLKGHLSAVTSVTFSPDGCYVLSGGGDRTLRLWRISDMQEQKIFIGHTAWVNTVAISPDGRYALSGGSDGTIRLWDIATGQEIQQLWSKGKKDVILVAFSRDGCFSLSVNNQCLQVWNLIEKREIFSYTVRRGLIHCASFLGNSQNILLAGGTVFEGVLTLLSWNEPNPIRHFRGYFNSINCVAASPNGSHFVSCSYDRKILFWDMDNERPLQQFSGHTGAILTVSCSPDGNYILSGSSDNTIRLWNIATGSQILVLEGHTEAVRSAAFSPDGRYALSGSEDNTICLWEFDWDYDFPAPADWDEGARPYLDIFLTLHTPYGPDGLSRVGKPQWTEEDFQKLLQELGYRGYGWLRPEGVRRELEKMAKERK